LLIEANRRDARATIKNWRPLQFEEFEFDSTGAQTILVPDFMAENIPNVPAGAVPPKKETGKVQPKKETVRINLPPKPSAAPTIKLPTLPPGGPTGAGGIPLPSASAHSAAAAPAPAAPAPRTATAAPASQRQPATPQQRTAAPAAAAKSATVSGLDTMLALVAAVVGLLAIGSTAYLAFMVLQ